MVQWKAIRAHEYACTEEVPSEAGRVLRVHASIYPRVLIDILAFFAVFFSRVVFLSTSHIILHRNVLYLFANKTKTIKTMGMASSVQDGKRTRASAVTFFSFFCMRRFSHSTTHSFALTHFLSIPLVRKPHAWPTNHTGTTVSSPNPLTYLVMGFTHQRWSCGTPPPFTTFEDAGVRHILCLYCAS